MGDPGQDPTRYLQLLWVPVAALCTFIWRQLSGKVDKEHLDRMHVENVRKFDYIIEKLDQVEEKLTSVQVDVANLKGRSGYNGHR